MISPPGLPPVDDRDTGESAAASEKGRKDRWRWRDTGVAGCYALLAFLVFHRLWGDPGGRYLVDGGQDQDQWEWFFAGTARAVLEFENPLFTDLQNHPLGVNLMANTPMLGLSVPLAPVTALLGPGVTWALVLTAGMAATATAWYRLLAQHVVKGWTGAAVGGGFCAFAPPVVSHANAHPNFVVLFVLPLLVGRLVRIAEGGPVRREGALLGLLGAYQLFLGEEALLLAATGLAVLFAGYRPAWAVARRLAAGTGVGLAVAVPLVAYPLAWQFFGPQSYDGLLHGPWGNDVVQLTGFARQSLAGHPARPGPLDASPTEQNAFFGWPLTVLVAAVTVWLWRLALVRALALVIAVATLLSLGPEIIVNGEPTGIAGPWRVLGRLPLYESVVESRLTLVCVPAIGVLLAVATDRIPGGRAVRPMWCLVLVQALLPIAPKPLAVVEWTEAPAFFTEGMWREYVTGALPSLRRLAHLLCKDPHRADDIVQNAITRLYVHWRRAQAADDIDRYVRTILVRAFLREQRLAWARVRLTGGTPGVAEPPAPPGPDVETRTVLHIALTRVPPRQRAVLVLRFLCDLPVAEVAEILKCSEGTVKSQTSQGLARLRTLLDAQTPEVGGGDGRDGRR